MSEDPNVELDRFREQWKEEVTARSKEPSASKNGSVKQPLGLLSSHSEEAPGEKRPPQDTEIREIKTGKDDDEFLTGAETKKCHYLPDKDQARRLCTEGGRTHPHDTASETSSSALEHYEKAIERDDQGNLGDSISLYRKAYRLDAGVDRIYRNKHFPPSSSKSKPLDPNPSNAPVTVPDTGHHSLDGPTVSAPNISQLIASFAGLSIPPIPPPTDQSPQPPCPISSLPSEILLDIMNLTAILDVAAFSRLSLVCKHLAHIIATEDRIWKRVCLGPEYGFKGMHYDWSRSLSGEPLSPHVDILQPGFAPATLDDLNSLFSNFNTNPAVLPPPSPISPVSLSPTYPTYRTMFRSRPRIRFNGCYISTVNYIRPGASTPSQVSWNTPVHIVTYYRYLRFFRDGTCVSLLTTYEPVDVVHHLSKANVPSSTQHGKTHLSLIPPMSIMQHALRGRWKLQSPTSASKEEPEGTLSIETLGIDPEKYTFVMSLALQSTRKKEGTSNNKLAWRGFWSYNKLTDDWAEFGLKNDKPYIWSRVGSYGMGE